jgi:hypothetical protein
LQRLLPRIGLADGDDHALRTSTKRFPDGGQYRIEIPSVEGPESMSHVLGAAENHGLRVHRVSQGSGVWLLTDDEIREMAALAASADTEVCLFIGPRAGWDLGRQATSAGGSVIAAALRGSDQLAYGLDEVQRACELGVRSVLVGDLGLLSALGRLKTQGDLPSDLQLKVSVALPVANAATARVLEDLGATSLNLAVDLQTSSIAAIRAAIDIPVDIYVEAPDDFGGGLRHYDIPTLVRVAAPVYLKFAVRNAPNTYPSGAHLQPAVNALSAERVRRARLGVDLLRRYMPDAAPSPSSVLGEAAPALRPVG